MFSFPDDPVKFIGLLLLFAGCTAWSLVCLFRPQTTRQRIASGLHLGMSVVMLLMVAPPTWHALVSVLPLPFLVGLFATATLWFGWLAIAAGRDGDRHTIGHALMFAAMTWHLAAMASMAASRSMEMPGGAPQHAGGPMLAFAVVGLPLMAYLLVSSLLSLWRAARPAQHHVAPSSDAELVCPEPGPPGSISARLGSLSAFAMNFGMFWMSTGLLTPLAAGFGMSH